jgi:hypothetical protein
MPWWRRETLHEKLAREGEVTLARDGAEREPSRPPWDKVGIHGVQRPRRWDAVVAVPVSGLPCDEIAFVALPDGTLVVDEEAPVEAEALSPLADALEESLSPPYRAEAVRRTDDLWAVAARSIDVADLPAGTPGERVTLSVQGGERTTLVDGEEWLASFPALEAIAEGRGLRDYVMEVCRIDGEVWELQLSPL